LPVSGLIWLNLIVFRSCLAFHSATGHETKAAEGGHAKWDALAFHGLVARKVSPSCPLRCAGLFVLRLVIIKRVVSPREIVGDRILDLDQRVLDVTTITAVPCDASVVAGDL
jgi:hypothetical protein